MEAIRIYVYDRSRVTDAGHSSDCWLWTHCRRDGYGRANIGGRTYQAHRIAYEAFLGEIPQGLELDHLCCVTNCVNPAHLEPVSREENLRRKSVRRGYVVGGKVRMEGGKRVPGPPRPPRTHCKHGHEYTPETTRMCVNTKGLTVRGCRVCLRAQNIARKRLLRDCRRQAITSGGVGANSLTADCPSTRDDIARHFEGGLYR